MSTPTLSLLFTSQVRPVFTLHYCLNSHDWAAPGGQHMQTDAVRAEGAWHRRGCGQGRRHQAVHIDAKLGYPWRPAERWTRSGQKAPATGMDVVRPEDTSLFTSMLNWAAPGGQHRDGCGQGRRDQIVHVHAKLGCPWWPAERWMQSGQKAPGTGVSSFSP